MIIEEVSDASGFSRSRSLDYMLINLWESRGLAITGIEQKTFRNDWLRELKNPKKQENHYKYCDHFYLLTAADGVAKEEEIPITWGWMHINKSGVLKIMKQAPKLDPVPVTRSFLCAMLRRAASKRNYVHVDDIEDRVKQEAEAIRDSNRRELQRVQNEYNNLSEAIRKFERESGIDVRSYTHDYSYRNPEELGRAVKHALSHRSEHYIDELKVIESRVKRIADDVSQAIISLNGANVSRETSNTTE